MSSEEQVRALLEDAVADVEPRHSLDTIRSRTRGQRQRSRTRGVAGVAAAVLATAATVATVVALNQGVRPPATGPSADDGSASPSPSRSGPTQLVYFVGTTPSGARLFPEPHRTPPSAFALDEAVADAVAGKASDADYRSPWPPATTMERAQVSDGVLSVDLSGPLAERPAGMTPADASIALQQLVYTAQAASGTQLPVTFLLGGRPTSTLLGEDTEQPVAAAAADDTLASVSVTSLEDGATVTAPFTVRGQAAAFEANVLWELVQGENEVAAGYATAAECCTLSPYSFTVKAPPGDYELRVHDEDPSGGEGKAPTQDTKRVTIR